MHAAEGESSRASSIAQVPNMPTGSANYVFFDAEHGRGGDGDSDDEGGGGKQKRKKRGVAGKTKEDSGVKRKEKG